ncbi:gamma carbonic anhydrase family protein, partial [Pseudomonas syringae pv. tagetis]
MKYRLVESRVQNDLHCCVGPNAGLIGNVRLESGASVWFNVVLRGDYELFDFGVHSTVQDGTVMNTEMCSP